MNENSEVVAELREIRAELKHINQRFDEALAYHDRVAEMRHEEHGKRIEEHEAEIKTLKACVRKAENRLTAYSAVISAVVIAAGILVRLL